MNKKRLWSAALLLFLIAPCYGQEARPLQDVPSLYKDGHYQAVIDLLKDKKVSDDQSAVYLGLSYLKLKETDQTISVWKKYAKIAPGGETTRRLSQYLTPLLKESAQQGAQKARQEEEHIAGSNLDPNSVAVAPFQNKGSSKYDSLSTGFAEMVISDLSQVKTLKVVERIKVQTLLNELKLSRSGLVDQNNAPKVGKLLGAGNMASGSFAAGFNQRSVEVGTPTAGEAPSALPMEGATQAPVIAKERLEINLSIVQTQQGQVLSAKESEGSLQEFYKIEKGLVVQVLCGMGRCPESLDEQTQAAVGRVHTTNLQAFLQFSKGLELRDKGRYREARQAFLQALASDPQFHLAQEQLLETPLFPITQEVVFSEEKNLSDNEKPVAEMPLSKSGSSVGGDGETENNREKPSSADAGASSPSANSAAFPVEQQPSSVLVPVHIQLQF